MVKYTRYFIVFAIVFVGIVSATVASFFSYKLFVLNPKTVQSGAKRLRQTAPPPASWKQEFMNALDTDARTMVIDVDPDALSVIGKVQLIRDPTIVVQIGSTNLTIRLTPQTKFVSIQGTDISSVKTLAIGDFSPNDKVVIRLTPEDTRYVATHVQKQL